MDIKKKRKYRIFSIMIFAGCILAYGGYNAYRSFKEDSRNPIHLLNSLPDDYNKLFNSSIREKLYHLKTVGFN